MIKIDRQLFKTNLYSISFLMCIPVIIIGAFKDEKGREMMHTPFGIAIIIFSVLLMIGGAVAAHYDKDDDYI